MRRAYGLTIVIATLLLVIVTVVSTLNSHQQMQGPTTRTGHAPVAADTSTEGYSHTDRLRPPPGSVKPVPPDPNYRSQACAAPVTNLSRRPGNEAESFVVVNPTNPNNIVVFSNLQTANSIFRGYSMDGGVSWTTGTVATGVACCDGQAAFDAFGNLFLVYINGFFNQVDMILSTNGGVSFTQPVALGTGTPGNIDQPSVAVGNGSVWVDWPLNGSIVARGAPVTGLGKWGPFGTEQTIPNASGNFSGIAVGPGPNGGKVMVTYMDPWQGEGPATIYVNVDADGLGAGGFGSRITVTSTNVGGRDFIPAQPNVRITAEPGLVWDATGGLFNNRAYLVYTEEPLNESNDTEIYVRTSTDDGVKWSAAVRVNDDPQGPIRSQFLPYITLDRTTGTVAIGWFDSRNDNGVPGSGGTNTTPNDDAEYYASYSTNGGVSWTANTRLSGSFSNAANASSVVDYGDYVGVSAHGGKFVGVWADNSNCDGTNANGTLGAFDLYMGTMNLTSGGPTPTPTICSVRVEDMQPGALESCRRYAHYVQCVICFGIGSGYTGDPNVFNPCLNEYESSSRLYWRPYVIATRGQAAKLVSNGAGYTEIFTSATFTDVPMTHPMWLFIERLYYHGDISGYNDPAQCPTGVPCFHPDKDVTRGQLIKMAVNARDYSGGPPNVQTFADVPNTDPFWHWVELAHEHRTQADTLGGLRVSCDPTPPYPTNPCTGQPESCDAQSRPYLRLCLLVTRGELARLIDKTFIDADGRRCRTLEGEPPDMAGMPHVTPSASVPPGTVTPSPTLGGSPAPTQTLPPVPTAPPTAPVPIPTSEALLPGSPKP
jgi:hypothetical protein